jgi:methionyl-tRNA formyltransferase
MKICAFVNEKVGYLTLKEILRKKIEVPLVFTSSLSRKKKISDWLDIKSHQNEFKRTSIVRIEDPKEKKIINKIKRFAPDLIIVISWSQIIPKQIIDVPKYGVVSSHYSSLPKRRGGAPLFWAIYDNLSNLGISIYYMQKGIDDGDIIDQTKIKIKREDNVTQLMKKIYSKYPKFYANTLNKIINGKSTRKPQDHKKATYTKARKPEEGFIDFKDSKKLERFVKALSPPYPPAFFEAVDKNGYKMIFKIINSNKKNGKLFFNGYLEK